MLFNESKISERNLDCFICVDSLARCTKKNCRIANVFLKKLKIITCQEDYYHEKGDVLTEDIIHKLVIYEKVLLKVANFLKLFRTFIALTNTFHIMAHQPSSAIIISFQLQLQLPLYILK